jgi:hypothetical protein
MKAGIEKVTTKRKMNSTDETNLPKADLVFLRSSLTVCVSRWWAGWDSLREQGKARSQKNA